MPAVVAITDNFDMVTVEKWQGEGCKPGSSVPGCFGGTGNTDKKIIGACAQLKKLKPSPPCIMYHDTNTVWDCADAGPPGFCSGRGLDNVAYDGAVQANSNPSKFLLHQPNGSLYVSSYVHAHVIDFRKKAGTALWVETCTNATATGMVDGCFADFCSWGLDDKQPGFSTAHNAAVNALSTAMGPTGLAIGTNCQHSYKGGGNLANWSSPSGVVMEGFSNYVVRLRHAAGFQQHNTLARATARADSFRQQVVLGPRQTERILREL